MLSAKEAFDKTVEGAQEKRKKVDGVVNSILKNLEKSVLTQAEKGCFQARHVTPIQEDHSDAVVKSLDEKLREEGYSFSYEIVEDMKLRIRVPFNHKAYEFQVGWSNIHSDKEDSK